MKVRSLSPLDAFSATTGAAGGALILPSSSPLDLFPTSQIEPRPRTRPQRRQAMRLIEPNNPVFAPPRTQKLRPRAASFADEPHDGAGGSVVAQILNVDVDPLGYAELDLIRDKGLRLVGPRAMVGWRRSANVTAFRISPNRSMTCPERSVVIWGNTASSRPESP